MAAGRVYKGKQKKKSGYITKGTGRVNQIRTRRIKNKELTPKQKLYRQVKAKVSTVNKRINRLKQGGMNKTWASRRLYERLDVGKLGKTKILNRRSYINISKDLNATQLNAIARASDLFLQSKTSTIKGIKETRNSVIESLRISLGEDTEMLSYDDAEFLYDLFDTTNFDDLAKYSNASTVWAHVEDYLQGKTDEDTLLDRLMVYGNLDYIKDLDIRDKTRDLLKKLLKRKYPNKTDEEIEAIINKGKLKEERI